MAVFLLWIIFSVVVGSVGSDRKIGFWSAFFWSLLLSPLIGIILAFNSTKNEEEEYRKKVLELQKSQIQPQSSKAARKELSEQLLKISTLFEKGSISEEEYNDLKNGLLKDLEDLE